MSEEEFVVWTGDNADEVEAFGRGKEFGFVVGSNYLEKPRWFQRVALWLVNRVPGGSFELHLDDDPRILEIYPIPDPDSDERWSWTHAAPGDRIGFRGKVTRQEDA